MASGPVSGLKPFGRVAAWSSRPGRQGHEFVHAKNDEKNRLCGFPSEELLARHASIQAGVLLTDGPRLSPAGRAAHHGRALLAPAGHPGPPDPELSSASSSACRPVGGLPGDRRTPVFPALVLEGRTSRARQRAAAAAATGRSGGAGHARRTPPLRELGRDFGEKLMISGHRRRVIGRRLRAQRPRSRVSLAGPKQGGSRGRPRAGGVVGRALRCSPSL
eukprot:tig00000382_g24551.t1